MEVGVAAPLSATNPYFALRRRVYRWGRAQVAAPLGIAVLGPGILAAAGLAGRLPAVALAALVVIPTPILESLLAVRTRREWAAQDVLGWLDWTALRRWGERTSAKRPRSPIEAGVWITGHPAGSAPESLRASVLILAGRVAEAREVIAALPSSTPGELRERLELELDADAFESRPLVVGAADDSVRADTGQSAAEIEVRLAYHAALAAVSCGGDGLAELAKARPAIGRLPDQLVRRLWLGRLRFAVLAFFLEVWILVSILVALSAASGTVLY